MWPNHLIIDLLGIETPIIQAPMAGANDATMAIAVSNAGGLGSIPCAMLDAEKIRSEIMRFRQHSSKTFNINFFCHTPLPADPIAEARWKESLSCYYRELDLDNAASASAASRKPFDESMCRIVEELKPPVVSFHFGLPEKALIQRVKDAGCVILSSATTVKEALWLESEGCDAIIAQGYEAGGHRGMFLSESLSSQMGTIALVPLIADAVNIPVIAGGGIADGRGVAAAFTLGAAAAQIGTAYLFTEESIISDLHRSELQHANDNETAVTNLFSGKPARSLMNRVMREAGPLSDLAPVFPTAGTALAPLKAKAESLGKTDFSSLWSGQAASLGYRTDAATFTQNVAKDAVARLSGHGA